MENRINDYINIVSEYNRSDNNIKIKENEPLCLHSTFKIGGNARIFAVPQSIDALIFLMETANKLDVRAYIVGNGSNILFDDAGFDGVVISTSGLNSIVVEGDIITAECGAMLSACAVKAKDAGLSGMECLFGIPGSVGGAVFMNAGAYGGEMKDIVIETTYLDVNDFTLHTVKGDDHEFGYRQSIFKSNRGIILNTSMKLKPADKNVICAAMDDYKERRITKQPLEFPSAGSTFKRYPGRYTGQMIEESGLKGRSIGGAQVSEKHAGFVINRENASSKDVLELIETIKQTIRENYGIDIETEVIYVK